MPRKPASDEPGQDALPGTDQPVVKFESLLTETSNDYQLGDSVEFSGSGIICGDKGEIKKDGTRRRLYWVRPDGVKLA